LAAHLLLVDVATAGPLACIWIEWRARRRGDPSADALAKRLAVVSLGALVVGGLLGGVLLGVRYGADDRAYLAALAAVPRERIWFGLLELLFSFSCLALYVGLWDRLRKSRVLHRLLALAGASNSLIHLPAFFTVVAVLSTRGQRAGEVLDRPAYRQMLLDGEVMSRVAHVWLAAAAVTGIVVAVLATQAQVPHMPRESRDRLRQQGAWLALAATLIQFPVGVWVTLQMPAAARRPMLGDDWQATGLFLAALLISVLLLHQLWSIAIGESGASRVAHALAAVSLLVLLMVGTRVRLAQQGMRDAERTDDSPNWAVDFTFDRSLPLRGEPVAFQ
jgi:hypothetical protein